jgi:hypothetical protein
MRAALRSRAERSPSESTTRDRGRQANERTPPMVVAKWPQCQPRRHRPCLPASRTPRDGPDPGLVGADPLEEDVVHVDPSEPLGGRRPRYARSAAPGRTGPSRIPDRGLARSRRTLASEPFPPHGRTWFTATGLGDKSVRIVATDVLFVSNDLATVMPCAIITCVTMRRVASLAVWVDRLVYDGFGMTHLDRTKTAVGRLSLVRTWLECVSAKTAKVGMVESPPR